MGLRQSASHLDIKDILSMVWRRKWLILSPAVLVAAATFGGSYLITPEYECSTIIKIDPQVQLIGAVQSLVGQPTTSSRRSSSKGQLKAIFNDISSFAYTTLLNESLQLNQLPHIESEARAQMQQQPSLPLEQARLNVLQAELKDGLEVEWAASDQIRLIITSDDPLQARDIANTLSEIFIEEKQREQLSQIRSSQDFSDVHLEKYERNLARIIRQRTNLEKNMLTAKLDESITSESNRLDISSEIDRTTREIEDLRADETGTLSLLAPISGIYTDRLTLQESNDKKRYMRELENQLSLIGDLMIRYTWNDPQILNFKVKINNLITSVENENGNLVDQQYNTYDQPTRRLLTRLFNTRSNLDYLYSKKPYLQGAMDELSAKINAIPESQARVAQLDREIAAATDLRDRFKRQQESSTISQALVEDMSSAKYRVVEPAKLPLSPVWPDRQRILLMGIILGLFIGGAAAMLIELLDNSFRKVEDVEETLGMTVLGIAPKIEFVKKL
jgi:succinoglycan biosynthesis transport protein ExoP